uniref:Uncharacterized protein n=1 Tax=Meleagris gallopavo TaxID=9103 RepID=A0A803YLZ9_MELGA
MQMYTHICRYTYMYVHICLHIFVFMHLCIHAYKYVHVGTYICWKGMLSFPTVWIWGKRHRSFTSLH